jgi:hypothetical protein
MLDITDSPTGPAVNGSSRLRLSSVSAVRSWPVAGSASAVTRTEVNVDPWPDDVPVRSFEPRVEDQAAAVRNRWDRLLTWRRSQIQSPVKSRPPTAMEMIAFMAADHAPAKFPSCHTRGQLRSSGVAPSRITA